MCCQTFIPLTGAINCFFWYDVVMALIYITGIAGAGKSEVYKELKSRGYIVYGIDEDQLAGFYDNETGERLLNPPQNPEDRTPEWRKKYTYKVPRKTIEELKSKSTDQDIYLCGVAGNEEEFLDLFDKLIALVIDDKTLEERITSRTTNNFGKTPHELAGIMDWQSNTSEYYRKYDYRVIDATQPVQEVVNEVIAP